MKSFKTLVKKLPKTTVVFAFGRFNPYTSGHELLTAKVKSVASSLEADHAIFLSRTQDNTKNPLSIEKKLYWAKRISKANFIAASPEMPSFMHVAKVLNKRYKNLVMIAGSDRVSEYEGKLNQYNGKEFHYDSIKVISAGDRDPDSDSATGMSGTKLREFAKNNDFESFKKGIPKSLSSLDSRRYFNDVQVGLGITPVQEHIDIKIDPLREAFFQGELHKVGDVVQDDKGIYEVLDIGSNYITVITEDGKISKKWPDKIEKSDVVFNAKYFGMENINGEIKEAFNKSLNDFKAGKFNDKLALVSSFININKYFEAFNKDFVVKAQSLLENINQLENHSYIKELLEMSTSPSDKLKIAVIIANTFGEAVKGKSPEELVNGALKEYKTLKLTAESKKAFKNMLEIAKDAGINYDHNLVKEEVDVIEGFKIVDKDGNDDGKLKRTFESKQQAEDFLKERPELLGAGYHPVQDGFVKESDDLNDNTIRDGSQAEEDIMSDSEIEDFIKKLSDDDYLDAYDEDELAVVDFDTGEELTSEEIGYDAEVLNEVLSRVERLKSKVRFARTKAKRERRLELALKRKSDNKTINKRARRLAIKVLKTRLAKKPINKLSVAEKERLEQRIAKSKGLINRISIKLVPKVKKIEKDRLEHKAFTKAN